MDVQDPHLRWKQHLVFIAVNVISVADAAAIKMYMKWKSTLGGKSLM